MIDFVNLFESYGEKDAVVWNGWTLRYNCLLERMASWRFHLRAVPRGAVVAVKGDYSFNTVALFFVLAERGYITILFVKGDSRLASNMDIAEAEWLIQFDEYDGWKIIHQDRAASHPHYLKLRRLGHSGLVVFSSGSTGESKAIVHDLSTLFDKFRARRASRRAIAFLLFDHLGGVNTLLHVLLNGGCLVVPSSREPENVFESIQKFKVDLLPVTPTFLSLALLSESYLYHDLSSLRTITYGTEPMPPVVLERWHILFPDVVMQQTYGLSEVGVLHSKSRDSNSLWVKLGGEGFETRVVEGVLQVKAQSTMLGYLNAPNPVLEDGWLPTGDLVEVEGEYVRIVGRKSELINVGGEKVHPSEVEGVIQEMDNVAEVVVFGQPNLILGSLVCARVRLMREELHKDFVARLKRHCRQRLQRYKVPMRVEISQEPLHTQRFKKARL